MGPSMTDLNTPHSPRESISSATAAKPWEREVLENLLADSLEEKRKERRRKTFFHSFWLILLMLLVLAIWLQLVDSSGSATNTRHTALVNMQGEISAEGGVSAENVNTALQNAFADAHSAAVILRINSPGGSPVQAGMINDEMRRLRKQYTKKPLYVVVEETCASGGYYVAAAADKIFVNQASIIGSIGVLIDSFGFVGLMKHLGVERRLYTAGENKAMLDPFLEPTSQHRAYVQKLLEEIHQQFIHAVREGRGARLKDTPEIFSGLTWSGRTSITLGLADEFGSVESVARDVVKAADIVDYTQHEGLVDRVSRRLGASIGMTMTKTLLHGGSLLR